LPRRVYATEAAARRAVVAVVAGRPPAREPVTSPGVNGEHDTAEAPGRPGSTTAGADQEVGGAATGGGFPPAPDVAQEAPRPTELDPQQLGYTPRNPVPWLSPVLLAGTAVRVVLAGLFGAYLDKRELQNVLPAAVYDERPTDSDELWLDYAADLGDGFDATYTIAYLLAQPELSVDGWALPRGRVLLMGGDEVYPTASGRQYEDRFKGPYRSALPAPPPGPRPTLYALPGNHDWYDGLTAFLRLFARVDEGRIGGWRTKQHRSYFAIRLPHRWWWFAIDAQYGAYLDDPQLRYFRAAAAYLRPGDRVIVCSPSPSWVQSSFAPHAYDTVDYFLRKIIAPTGAEVRLMLSGDMHHYARYSGPRRELITCGGGGAYLYPTHRLPARIDVPPPASLARTASPIRTYELAATYPTKADSRRYAAGVFGRLPWRNRGFSAMVAVLHLLLMLSLANVMQRIGAQTDQQLLTIPLGVMVTVTMIGTMLFALPSTGGPRRYRHWVLGFVHGLGHIGLAYLGALLWLRLPLYDLPFPLPLLAAVVTYLPVAGLVGSLLVGLYLLVASVFDVNVNELFAGQGIIDVKSFLRLHIAADGSLTVHPIAVDRVGRKWTANPDAPAHRPWIEPVGPVRYRLAEQPVRIG
jgi:hypothetical protein